MSYIDIGLVLHETRGRVKLTLPQKKLPSKSPALLLLTKYRKAAPS